MKYKVQDSDEIVDGEILEKLSENEYKIKSLEIEELKAEIQKLEQKTF